MILFSALMFACSDEEEAVEEPVDSAQEVVEEEDSSTESLEVEE